MTILLVQIFLLLLAAFLVGAVTACFLRRGVMGKETVASGLPPMLPGGGGGPSPRGGSESATRFERALTGEPGSSAPPRALAPGSPMIEVQSVAVALAAPSPPRAAPAPQSPLPASPQQRDVTPATAEPSAQPAKPAPQSYTAIAAAHAAAAAAQPRQVAETAADSNNLTRIRSIDGETARRLAALGVRRFADIARWGPDDIARIGQALGIAAGRIEQENWVGQAEVLARRGEGLGQRARGDAAPVPAPPAPAVAQGPDRLTRIIGLDPATERALIENGVTRFSEIAAWGQAEVEWAEQGLGAPGRVGRERWIEQAQVLARGANGVTGASAPVVAPVAAPTPAAPIAALPAQTAPSPRAEVTVLRSVRSEALRRDPAEDDLPNFGTTDDLKRIRGIGILIEKKLNSLGILTYEQVANWSSADVDRISQLLDFKGRIERENWVEQARILASGGHTDFSRRADRGEAALYRDQRS